MRTLYERFMKYSMIRACVLGVLVVIGGLSYFFNALGAQGGRNWILIILSALIVVGGIVVIINPFSSLLVLFRIFGVLLILSCIEEMITYFSYKRLTK